VKIIFQFIVCLRSGRFFSGVIKRMVMALVSTTFHEELVKLNLIKDQTISASSEALVFATHLGAAAPPSYDL
jgi:hypothetical protein